MWLKRLSFVFFILFVVVLSELFYFFNIKDLSPRKESKANTIQSSNIIAKIDEFNRVSPLSYYQIDKSFVDFFFIMKKDSAKTYYVMEKEGTVSSLELISSRFPDNFCFILKEENNKYCVPKTVLVYSENELGERKVVPYLDLKNDMKITYIATSDLTKPMDKSFVSINVRIKK